MSCGSISRSSPRNATCVPFRFTTARSSIPAAFSADGADGVGAIVVTALAVAGRSGTAIAAELATNQVMGEVRALEGMGIDPRQYLVVPRFVGGLISVFILMILFDVVAVAGGLLAASFSGMTPGRYMDVVLQALTLRDVWLTVAKAFAFGIVVGLVPSFYGLAVRRGPTEIPIAANTPLSSLTSAMFT